MSEEIVSFDQTTWNEIETACNFKVQPFEETFALSDPARFAKISLSPEAKNRLSQLFSHIPGFAAAKSMSSMVRVVFPDGASRSLMQLAQGGFASQYLENGRIAGTASLYSVISQARALRTFSLLSVVCGQYYLAQINKEMSLINQKLDKLLEFLYGDKKAELLSEISFVKYAYENFRSIMENEQQRIATIANVQAAKKVAMKDIEFYIVDMDKLAASDAKTASELEEISKNAFRIYECLTLSTQLFTMSSLLEIFFSQNTDASYLEYVEHDNTAYLEKCEKRTLACLSVLKHRVEEFNPKIPLQARLDKNTLVGKIDEIIERITDENAAATRKSIHAIVTRITHSSEVVLLSSGDAYIAKGA